MICKSELDRAKERIEQSRSLIDNFIEACKAQSQADRDIFTNYALRRAEHAIAEWDKEKSK
jgi:hypothetical protein